MKRLIPIFFLFALAPLHAALTCAYEPLTGLILCTAGGSGVSGTVSGTAGALAAFTSSTAVGDATEGNCITVTSGTVGVDSTCYPVKFTSASAPVSGSDACATGDIWVQTGTALFFCDDGSTDHWTQVNPAITVKKTYGASFFNNGSALTAVTTSIPFSIPDSCTVSAWTISVDAGTATFKVWKAATGTAIPTISDVINTSGIAISTGTHVRSTTLTDFSDTTWTAGDIIRISMTAVATATMANVGIECNETH